MGSPRPAARPDRLNETWTDRGAFAVTESSNRGVGQIRGRRRRSGGRSPVLAALAMGTVLVVTACSSDDDAAPEATSTTAPATSTTEEAGADPAVADARSAIDWFVEVLNGDELDAERYEILFSEEFRRAVPFDAGFLPQVEALRASAPYTVVEPAGPGPQGQATVNDAAGTALVVGAAVEGSVITALVIQPAEPPTLDDPPATIAEALERLGALGTAGALVAEVAGEICTPIEAVAADQPAPVGSVFKLYVLAALGEEIAAGTTTWDEELTIRDELKSLPTGVLQDRPDGETVTVRETAELMISISDNTATDLLIHHLGRERIEQAMADLGVDPAGNVPLLTTRDMFVLKLGPEEQRREYLAADAEGRRELLDEVAATDLSQVDPADFTEPVAVEEVEWFMSPDQLCRVAVHLGRLAGQEGLQAIDEILSANPGIPSTGVAPDSLWFKGGSEPGVVAGWWRATAGDRTIVVTGSVVDPDRPVDELQALLLLAAARDLAIGGS